MNINYNNLPLVVTKSIKKLQMCDKKKYRANIYEEWQGQKNLIVDYLSVDI